MKGKGAIFLVDGMAMSSPQGNMPELQQMQPKIGQANDTGLGELLDKYGFKIDQDFVFDRQNVPGPVDVGGRKMLANLPVFVGVKTERSSDKDFSVLAGVKALVFPFASSVELVGPLAGGKPTAPGTALDAGQDLAQRLEADRLLLLLARHEDRGGQGEGLVRPRLRLPGPAQERLRARGDAGDVDARPARHAALGVEEAGAPGGRRRLGLRVRRVPADGALSSPLYQERRADAVQRHQLDDGGRGAHAGPHEDRRRRARSRSNRSRRSRRSRPSTSRACRSPFIGFGLLRWRVRRATPRRTRSSNRAPRTPRHESQDAHRLRRLRRPGHHRPLRPPPAREGRGRG